MGGGGTSKFLADGGDSPHRPSRENLESSDKIWKIKFTA